VQNSLSSRLASPPRPRTSIVLFGPYLSKQDIQHTLLAILGGVHSLVDSQPRWPGAPRRDWTRPRDRRDREAPPQRGRGFRFDGWSIARS